MTERHGSSRTVGRAEIPGLFAALAIAVALTLVLARVARTGDIVGPTLTVVADLVVWIPLLVGVWVVVRTFGVHGMVRRLGLRFAVTDVFWGIAVACIVRAFDAFVQLGLYGSTGLSPAPVLLGGPTWAFAVLLVAGPGVVSPIVEELFFRGALQRRIAARFVPGAGRAFWGQTAAVVITSLVFAIAHLFVAGSIGGGGSVTVLSTFVLGLLLGGTTAATERIGAALIGHVLFNAIALWLTWPW